MRKGEEPRDEKGTERAGDAQGWGADPGPCAAAFVGTGSLALEGLR